MAPPTKFSGLVTGVQPQPNCCTLPRPRKFSGLVTGVQPQPRRYIKAVPAEFSGLVTGVQPQQLRARNVRGGEFSGLVTGVQPQPKAAAAPKRQEFSGLVTGGQAQHYVVVWLHSLDSIGLLKRRATSASCRPVRAVRRGSGPSGEGQGPSPAKPARRRDQRGTRVHPSCNRPWACNADAGPRFPAILALNRGGCVRRLRAGR